jgi:hypothetical protein
MKLLGTKFEYEPLGVIDIKNSAAMPAYILHRKGTRK